MTSPAAAIASLTLGLSLAAVLGLVTAGCQSCSDARDATEASPRSGTSGPTMPVGMLAPLPDAAPPPAPGAAERLSMARGKTAGEWAELQVARANDGPDRRAFERWQPDSRFLSLDAMRLLHDAFARALPGFDLFLPRHLDGAALGRLRAELAVLKTALAAMPDARSAKARWGEASSLVAALPDDVAWLDARAALLGTIDALTELAVDLEAKGEGLWVLGS